MISTESTTDFQSKQKSLQKVKPKAKRPTIGVSLFVSFLTFSLVLVGLLWMFQTVFLDRFYRGIKTSEIKRTASVIAANINHDELETLITRIAQQGDLSIRIFTVSGGDLASFEIGPTSLINHLAIDDLYELYDKTVASGGEYLELYDRSEFNDDRYDDRKFAGAVPLPGDGLKQSIIYSRQVVLSDGTSAVILINTMLSPVTATVQTLRVQLIYVTVILTLLSMILAWVLSRQISRPIIRINKRSKEMAAGDYQVRFEASGYKEVEELAETLNETATELSRVESLRRELIANISHDLRTPLTMIRGYAEVMRDLPGENNPENVQVIIDESNRLANLVNHILDLSKLQSGTQHLKVADYDLTAAVGDIVDRVGKLTEAEGYHVDFEATEKVTISGDAARIEQVMYNLLTNAVHYTGADHRVLVRQSVTDGWVRMAVIDSGEGIAPEELKHIWDRYYKSDKSHRRAVVGTGLGLSIVKQILELHHARYGVDSLPGHGATFWFELPVRK
ncbi:MAG: HAMP domain-containing sensor histidine kinase [Eubacteriales bacterium]|nr:HAMP domain-containing sensor histidine kinase [Eubacteriales bacterium]